MPNYHASPVPVNNDETDVTRTTRGGQYVCTGSFRLIASSTASQVGRRVARIYHGESEGSRSPGFSSKNHRGQRARYQSLVFKGAFRGMIRGEMHERATRAKQYRAQAERARASAKSFMRLADNYEKMAHEVEPEGQSRD